MTTTTAYPATVRELAETAAAQGVAPSELLATLPPAGYTLDADSVGDDEEGVWIGPDISGQGWSIMSQWTREHGLTFWVDGYGTNPIPATEAGKLSAAIAGLANRI
ncbi:hypothetical protein ACFVYC_01995 [Pseudarthrobacter sp. NPDC058329]|uniref:hypothetical protein n=1 Tax=Pseudarthrobacter sp. NPDC058329 TaxID=3346448 RepID=UPI0036D7E47B